LHPVLVGRGVLRRGVFAGGIVVVNLVVHVRLSAVRVKVFRHQVQGERAAGRLGLCAEHRERGSRVGGDDHRVVEPLAVCLIQIIGTAYRVSTGGIDGSCLSVAYRSAVVHKHRILGGGAARSRSNGRPVDRPRCYNHVLLAGCQAAVGGIGHGQQCTGPDACRSCIGNSGYIRAVVRKYRTLVTVGRSNGRPVYIPRNINGVPSAGCHAAGAAAAIGQGHHIKCRFTQGIAPLRVACANQVFLGKGGISGNDTGGGIFGYGHHLYIVGLAQTCRPPLYPADCLRSGYIGINRECARGPYRFLVINRSRIIGPLDLYVGNLRQGAVNYKFTADIVSFTVLGDYPGIHLSHRGRYKHLTGTGVDGVRIRLIALGIDGGSFDVDVLRSSVGGIKLTGHVDGIAPDNRRSRAGEGCLTPAVFVGPAGIVGYRLRSRKRVLDQGSAGALSFIHPHQYGVDPVIVGRRSGYPHLAAHYAALSGRGNGDFGYIGVRIQQYKVVFTVIFLAGLVVGFWVTILIQSTVFIGDVIDILVTGAVRYPQSEG